MSDGTPLAFGSQDYSIVQRSGFSINVDVLETASWMEKAAEQIKRFWEKSRLKRWRNEIELVISIRRNLYLLKLSYSFISLFSIVLASC